MTSTHRQSSSDSHLLRRAVSSSSSAALFRRARTGVMRSWRSSAVRQLTRTHTLKPRRVALVRAWRRSRTNQHSVAPLRAVIAWGWRRFRITVGRSFLFQYVTKEPDVEVIVIDLRKTHVAGTVIAMRVRLANRLASRAVPSLVTGVVSFIGWLATITAASHTSRIVSNILEPPAPPE